MKIVAGILSEDMLRKEAIILYDIQKSEVVQNDFTRTKTLLSALNSCGKQGRGKIGLSFAFHDDPRELCEIPEVVTYIRQLFALCPQLLYFLLPDQDSIRAFLFCLCGAKIRKKSNGMAYADVDEAVYIKTAVGVSDNAKAYGKKIGDMNGAEKLLQQMGF